MALKLFVQCCSYTGAAIRHIFLRLVSTWVFVFIWEQKALRIEGTAGRLLLSCATRLCCRPCTFRASAIIIYMCALERVHRGLSARERLVRTVGVIRACVRAYIYIYIYMCVRVWASMWSCASNRCKLGRFSVRRCDADPYGDPPAPHPVRRPATRIRWARRM